MSESGFHHAVVLVHDLARARQDFEMLGFTVSPGGRHEASGTDNALIPFEDGSYIELLAFRGWWRRLAIRWLKRFGLLSRLVGGTRGLSGRLAGRAGGGEGLVDFALRTVDIEADLAKAHAAGLALEGPTREVWVRESGQEILCDAAVPRARDLPFLCADAGDAGLAAPPPGTAPGTPQHANATTGIAGIVVAVENLEASSARYRALLAVQPTLADVAGLAAGRGRAFALDGAEVVLIAPAGVSPVLRKHLAEHGDGPYSLRLRARGDFPSRTLNPTHTHGTRIELVH